MKKLMLWVTKEEEQFIQAGILEPKILQGEGENP